jgi:hypothetical protein
MTWAKACRTTHVRTDPRRDYFDHRGEVYGEQREDGLAIWWRECNTCDVLSAYAKWSEAVADAVGHCDSSNGAVRS